LKRNETRSCLDQRPGPSEALWRSHSVGARMVILLDKASCLCDSHKPSISTSRTSDSAANIKSSRRQKHVHTHAKQLTVSRHHDCKRPHPPPKHSHDFIRQLGRHHSMTCILIQQKEDTDSQRRRRLQTKSNPRRSDCETPGSGNGRLVATISCRTFSAAAGGRANPPDG
jgi:hypothetical protein